MTKTPHPRSYLAFCVAAFDFLEWCDQSHLDLLYQPELFEDMGPVGRAAIEDASNGDGELREAVRIAAINRLQPSDDRQREYAEETAVLVVGVIKSMKPRRPPSPRETIVRAIASAQVLSRGSWKTTADLLNRGIPRADWAQRLTTHNVRDGVYAYADKVLIPLSQPDSSRLAPAFDVLEAEAGALDQYWRDFSTSSRLPSASLVEREDFLRSFRALRADRFNELQRGPRDLSLTDYVIRRLRWHLSRATRP